MAGDTPLQVGLYLLLTRNRDFTSRARGKLWQEKAIPAEWELQMQKEIISDLFFNFLIWKSQLRFVLQAVS